MLTVCPTQHHNVTKTREPYVNPNTAPKLCHSGSEFFNLTSVGIWSQLIPCCGGRPGHYRTLSSVPGLYPPDARSTGLPSPDVTLGDRGQNVLLLRSMAVAKFLNISEL